MNPSFARAWALLLLVLGTAAAADPGYYVVTVYDDPGVRTVDFRYWTVERPGRPATTWPEVGLGLNVNGRWYTELLASWIGASNAATRLSAVEWQNDLLLTLVCPHLGPLSFRRGGICHRFSSLQGIALAAIPCQPKSSWSE